MFRKLFPVAILFLIFSCSGSRLVPLSDDQLKAKMKEHISMLASDNFEGRETGLPGEERAFKYISKELKKMKMKPAGTDGYLQPFVFQEGAEYGKSTQLLINNSIFKCPADFYPLPYSSNAVITGYVTRVGFGITDQALSRDDYRGKVNIAKKIFVIETGTPDGNTPHGKFGEWTDLRKKIDLAVTRGASAVVFINSDTSLAEPVADWNIHTTPVKIPVVFAKGKAAELLRDSVVKNCTLGAEMIKIERTGHNIIAYADNKAASTIIIGAHYDHLGYGSAGSLYRGEKAIHNGADDNASGCAALLELVRYVKTTRLDKSNYLFIFFSGEEKGLLGSNYFLKHPTVDTMKFSCMINMDMLGRLKPEEEILIINGTGTSPSWDTIINSQKPPELKLKTTESGVGPSDHTSFYLHNIPVLHFFSGAHSDYHKPSDDEDKINYSGLHSTVRMIQAILRKVDGKPKLKFTKTKDDENEDAPKFKVTLGVVPDYSFEGEGMRIDGVSDGKPASKAGLLPGDVVIMLGENKVLDMMSYMQALGKFNKGETTVVKYMRGGKEMVSSITF
jgi:aminopeptidase YwaD